MKKQYSILTCIDHGHCIPGRYYPTITTPQYCHRSRMKISDDSRNRPFPTDISDISPDSNPLTSKRIVLNTLQAEQSQRWPRVYHHSANAVIPSRTTWSNRPDGVPHGASQPCTGSRPTSGLQVKLSSITAPDLGPRTEIRLFAPRWVS